MKYAFTTFSCPTATLDEALALARRYGYEGIEPRAEQDHAHGIELNTKARDRQAIRDKVEQSGIEICCIGTSCKYADPRYADKHISDALYYLDLAAEVGSRKVRVFGGGFPEEVSRERAFESLVTSLQAVADEAGAREVTICLETHDAWCDPELVAGVMREVNHLAVGVVWDVMHTTRQGGASMTETYGLLKPWIRHVHVHDGRNTLSTLKMLPLGSGDFDHKEVVRLLLEDRYHGFVSGEWIASTMDPEFFASHLEQELASLKRYEQEFS